MKEWQGICTHHEKDKLGEFLREIILYKQMLPRKGRITDEKSSAAYRASKSPAALREVPNFIVTDAKDDEGNYIIVDADTGEITPFVAVEHTMKGVTNWTAAEYIEVEASQFPYIIEPNEKRANKKEAFREESLF